jgi:Spx/MgsR family transcriptional regulator
MLTLYGIPNCDTVKKAQTLLQQNNIDFEFHNYKKQGISAEKIQQWLNEGFTWEDLINKKGTTWKKIEDTEKPNSPESATILMLEQTSVIRRPILEQNGKIIFIGFDEAKWSNLQ